MLQRRSQKLSGSLFKKLVRRLKFFFSGSGGFVRFLLPILLSSLALFLLFIFFTIRHLDCSLNNLTCPVELLERLNKYQGTNFLLLNQKKLIASIKDSYPVEEVNLSFRPFNTLQIKVIGQSVSLNIQVSLLQNLPNIGSELTGSTLSGSLKKPTEELASFSLNQKFDSFEIWDSGLMTPTASVESKIKYFISEKPATETIKEIYQLIKLIEKYRPVEQYWILNQTIFLRQMDQPDIIINIPFEEDSLVQVLQSYSYLTTIKKDTKVIDLRFKNPILR